MTLPGIPPALVTLDSVTVVPDVPTRTFAPSALRRGPGAPWSIHAVPPPRRRRGRLAVPAPPVARRRDSMDRPGCSRPSPESAQSEGPRRNIRYDRHRVERHQRGRDSRKRHPRDRPSTGPRWEEKKGSSALALAKALVGTSGSTVTESSVTSAGGIPGSDTLVTDLLWDPSRKFYKRFTSTPVIDVRIFARELRARTELPFFSSHLGPVEGRSRG